MDASGVRRSWLTAASSAVRFHDSDYRLHHVRAIAYADRFEGEPAFEAAIEEVFQASRRLLTSLETNATPRDREIEAQKAKLRSAERFGRPVPA